VGAKEGGETTAAAAPPSSSDLSPEEQRAQSVRLQQQDLGSGKAQLERLLQPHHAWVNLNPFEVLLLPHTATDDDIQTRYRKLSALVHPDKHPSESERANAAFQEVKRALDALCGEAAGTKRAVAVGMVERAVREARKQWRKERDAALASKLHPSAAKRTSPPAAAAAVPDEARLEELTRQLTRRSFADVEHRRRTYEQRIKAEAVREAEAELEERAEAKRAAEAEAEWRANSEARMQNWIAFQQQKGAEGLGAGETATAGGLKLNAAARFGAAKASASGDTAAPADEYRRRWR
jgi:hypothetical protein